MTTSHARNAAVEIAAILAASIVCLLSARAAHADETYELSGVRVTTAVHAPQDKEAATVHVSYADLDLTTAKGTKALYARLDSAAESVCGDDPRSMRLEEILEIQRCRQKAIEDAVEKLDRPRLTALYERRFPRAPLG